MKQALVIVMDVIGRKLKVGVYDGLYDGFNLSDVGEVIIPDGPMPEEDDVIMVNYKHVDTDGNLVGAELASFEPGANAFNANIERFLMPQKYYDQES
jgi:hypothetical protein